MFAQDSNDNMTEIAQVTRQELSAPEVIDIVEDGGRVIIEMSVLGKTTKVVIRQQSGTYYCDTPMKLLKYDERSDLRACLERFRLVDRQPEAESDVGRATV